MRPALAVIAGLLAVGLVLAFLLGGSGGDVDVPTAEEERGTQDATNPRLAGSPIDAAAPAPAEPAAAPSAAWRLTGRVVEAEGSPVAGARVEAWLDPGGTRIPLPSTESREDGTYEIALDDLRQHSTALRVTSGVVVSARKLGYRPAEEVEIRPLPFDVSEGMDLALDVRLVEGGRVTGTVTRRDGEMLADVSVYLLSAKGDQVLDSAESDATGAFQLGFGERPAVTVWAVSRAHGVAQTDPLSPDPEGETDVGELRLVPGETIEGRVLFADGSPIEGAWLYANLEEAVGDDPYPGISDTVIWRQLGAGTDAEGGFSMQAFRPGTYRIELGDAYGEVPETVVRSGRHDVEIVVPLHKLVVRVRDENGAPLPGCMHAISGWVPEAREDFERAVRGELDQPFGGGQVGITGHVAEADGRVQMLVRPGSAWIFRFELEGLPPLEHVARIPLDGNASVVELVAGAQRSTGHLAIEVLDAYDAPIEVFDFELRSLLGSTLARGGSADPASLQGLPAGPAKLEVHPGPARHRMDRMAQYLSPYFPIVTDVDVPVGNTAEITLRARKGGWIRLTAELAGEPEDDALGGVRVDVRPVGSEGPWTYVWMYVYDKGDDILGSSQLKPNVSVRLGALFEPGPQELKMQGHGFGAVTVPVTVVAGEETKVRARIERR